MKQTTLFLLLILFYLAAKAQVPQAFTYQAIVRDNAGNPILNQNVSLRISIHDATAGGAIVYREVQTIPTNNVGSITVRIGQGTILIGTFPSIIWGTNNKFLQIEMDITGGSSYVDMGTQQLLSVPYALFAGSSNGTAGGDLSGQYPNPTVARINGSPLGTTSGASTGNVLKWNGTSWSVGTDNNSAGTVTSVTAGTGLSGGTFSVSGTISMPNVGTAGTYGSGTQIPVITTDAQGRISNVTTANVAGSNAWTITGNNNIVDGTNFLGTTNNVPLTIRVNNLKSGRIDFVTPFNTTFGYQSGLAFTTARDNSSFGYATLSATTTGNENTAMGSNALLSNVGGWGNTAVGYHSQINACNTTSQTFPYNTSIGHNSLQGSSVPADNTGTINTAIGAYTLYNNSSGSNNTAVGFQAMVFNTTGSINTALGMNSLYSNTTGLINIAVGSNALYSNIDGSNNTAIGYQSLYSAVHSDYGVAIGYHSQRFANDGVYTNTNTSVGDFSLRGSGSPSNNSCAWNVAFGYNSMQNNTTGSFNVAMGGNSLYSNNSGNFNTAIGYQSLFNNSAQSLTSIGYQCLFNNTSGIRNTAVGEQAMFLNTTGLDNVSIGAGTLFSTTGSNYNTAIGPAAGGLWNHGNFNTFVGHSATTNAGGFSNSTALGDNTVITGSDMVRIGNLVTSIGGPQNWSNTSDGRIKINVREDIPGISFIKMLRPVSYNKSISKENEIKGINSATELSPSNNYEQIRYSGFIAQEVEEAANSIGYDFSGVDKPKNEKDLYSLRYAEFVVPMVKAMQEQQAMIEEQMKLIEQIKNENEKLRAEMDVLKDQASIK